jgi:hypothetical protein
VKYRVAIDYDVDDATTQLQGAAVAMGELMKRVAASTSGRVAWVQRLDAIWCDECSTYHDGDRTYMVD